MEEKELRSLRRETRTTQVQRVKNLLYSICGLTPDQALEVLDHTRISISLDRKPKKRRWKK